MNKQSSDESLPSTSWEVMGELKDKFGNKKLQKVFNRSESQINKYCVNPAYSEDSHPNPFDKMVSLFAEMADYGERERQVVRIAVNLLGEQCGFKAVSTLPVEPAAQDLRAEFMEIYKSLNDLLLSAERKDGPLVVESYKATAHELLEAFLVHYTRDYQANGGKIHFSKTMSPESVPFWKRAWMKIQGISS